MNVEDRQLKQMLGEHFLSVQGECDSFQVVASPSLCIEFIRGCFLPCSVFLTEASRIVDVSLFFHLFDDVDPYLHHGRL